MLSARDGWTDGQRDNPFALSLSPGGFPARSLRKGGCADLLLVCPPGIFEQLHGRSLVARGRLREAKPLFPGCSWMRHVILVPPLSCRYGENSFHPPCVNLGWEFPLPWVFWPRLRLRDAAPEIEDGGSCTEERETLQAGI